jgi:hypothetical protein
MVGSYCLGTICHSKYGTLIWRRGLSRRSRSMIIYAESSVIFTRTIASLTSLSVCGVVMTSLYPLHTFYSALSDPTQASPDWIVPQLLPDIRHRHAERRRAASRQIGVQGEEDWRGYARWQTWRKERESTDRT